MGTRGENYKRDGHYHKVTVPGNKYLGIIYRFPEPVPLEKAHSDYLYKFEIDIVDCSDLASATDDDEWIKQGRTIATHKSLCFEDITKRNVIEQVNWAADHEGLSAAIVEAKASGVQMMDLCLGYLGYYGGEHTERGENQFASFADACRHFHV
jgi:hypothetical protein